MFLAFVIQWGCVFAVGRAYIKHYPSLSVVVRLIVPAFMIVFFTATGWFNYNLLVALAD